MVEKIANFIDVNFPNKKRFGLKYYHKLHTFPINKATLEAYENKYKDTHSMKVIPVIDLRGEKEYMVYIRERKKQVK